MLSLKVNEGLAVMLLGIAVFILTNVMDWADFPGFFIIGYSIWRFGNEICIWRFEQQ